MKSNHQLEQDKKNEAKLFEAIASIKNAEEAKSFFYDLCTPAEIQAMADRWQVIPLIEEGKPYREIFALTGVSVTTIGRVARSLKYGSGGYQTIYERISKFNYAIDQKTQSGNTKKRKTS